MRKIIFVCTGNTCRSPMAEAAARSIFAKNNIDIEVCSRGISVFYRAKAHPNSVKALADRGIELKEHYALQITNDDISPDCIIVTMTISQKNYIKMNFPKADRLVFTLYEMAGFDPADVADPYCEPLAVYEKCCDEIIGLIENMINKHLIDNKAV